MLGTEIWVRNDEAAEIGRRQHVALSAKHNGSGKCYSKRASPGQGFGPSHAPLVHGNRSARERAISPASDAPNGSANAASC